MNMCAKLVSVKDVEYQDKATGGLKHMYKCYIALPDGDITSIPSFNPHKSGEEVTLTLPLLVTVLSVSVSLNNPPPLSVREAILNKSTQASLPTNDSCRLYRCDSSAFVSRRRLNKLRHDPHRSARWIFPRQSGWKSVYL